MSLATREQKAVVTDFAGDGRFLITFSRDEKVMRERLEVNKSERLRLKTAIKYKTSECERPSTSLLFALKLHFTVNKLIYTTVAPETPGATAIYKNLLSVNVTLQ